MTQHFSGRKVELCSCKILCSVVMLFSLVAPASVYAKDLGASINVPESSKVQLLNEGHFKLKIAGPQLSGTFDCMCTGGSGSCEVASIVFGSNRLLACERGKTGTCKGDCSMITNDAGETVGANPGVK
jgi:hypothetical protein